MDMTPIGALSWVKEAVATEKHAIIVELPAERVLQIALEAPVVPDKIVAILFLARGLGRPQSSIYDFWKSYRFIIADQGSRHVVFGYAFKIGRRGEPAQSISDYRDWQRSGIKIAADIRAVPIDEYSTLLVTETRVGAYDRPSRILFVLYWTFIGPFSAIIRRRWLREIYRRCKSCSTGAEAPDVGQIMELRSLQPRG
jgi:hypothetical protein